MITSLTGNLMVPKPRLANTPVSHAMLLTQETSVSSSPTGCSNILVIIQATCYNRGIAIITITSCFEAFLGLFHLLFVYLTLILVYFNFMTSESPFYPHLISLFSPSGQLAC